MNYNPCITIDVSQGKSHIQGFIGYNNKNRKPDNITQPKVMRHSKQGFNKRSTKQCLHYCKPKDIGRAYPAIKRAEKRFCTRRSGN